MTWSARLMIRPTNCPVSGVLMGSAKVRRITFVTKELGDHTSRLRQKLHVGQNVKIEGPYGCFDFDNGQPRQIWIGGGIGTTPFIAGMKHIALWRPAKPDQASPAIDLFHTTADYDETAITKLKADAEAANICLHIFVDARDGLLTGDRIRAEAPEWRTASIWFCGPTGFGDALRKDFAVQGLPWRSGFINSCSRCDKVVAIARVGRHRALPKVEATRSNRAGAPTAPKRQAQTLCRRRGTLSFG